MSYLLETLGRGLLGRLFDGLESCLPCPTNDDVESLAYRRRDACTSFDLAIRFGAACLRESRLTEARQAFEHALGLDGPTQPALIGLACVYDDLAQLDQAARYVQRTRDNDQRNPSLAFAVGFCHERLGDVNAAAREYTRAAELCPQLRNAHERLTAIAVQRGEWEAARRSCSRLAELDPGDIEVLLTLGSLQFQEGRPEDAVETFQRALLIEPEVADEGLDACAELEDDSRLRQTINTLENMVEKYPSVSEFRVHLADLYAKAGDDGGAVTQYTAALDLHPTFLEATVKLGTQHLRRQRYEDAAQQFNRAVELNDRLLTAFVGLGVAQRASGCQADADATFDLAASLAPNSTLLFAETNRLHLKALRSYADEYGLEEELDEGPGQEQSLLEAIRRHQQCLLSQPQRADLHYRHGMLLRQIGDFAPAAQAFHQAMTINPSYTKALIKLGITRREMGQCDAAFDAFDRVLKLDPIHVRLHYELALLFAQSNRFDLALERFEAGLVGKAGAAEFRHNLALALQNTGMIDRADATWRSVCELSRHGGVVSGHDQGAARRNAQRE